VRLKPSLAVPPTTQHLQPDTPPEPTVPVLLPRMADPRQATPPPQQSPPRRPPATAPLIRPQIPQLASALVSPAPRDPVRETPHSQPRTAPDLPALRQQDTSPTFAASDLQRRLRPPPAVTPAPSRRIPNTAASTPRPTRTSIPPSPPLSVAVSSQTHRPRGPRPTNIAPSPPPASVAQPASQPEQGTIRSLPSPLPDNPIPDYPASAARAGRQGVVFVLMDIDSTGRVANVSVGRSSGHADLDRAALAAARRWTFRPARRGDQSVAVTVLKPFRFVLNRR